MNDCIHYLADRCSIGLPFCGAKEKIECKGYLPPIKSLSYEKHVELSKQNIALFRTNKWRKYRTYLSIASIIIALLAFLLSFVKLNIEFDLKEQIKAEILSELKKTE